jgi:nucleotide-binding universal stress UspA family protein
VIVLDVREVDHPAPEHLDEARELVVLESRRMSELRRLVSGNVVRQFEQRVDCPVQAVRY